MGAHANAIPYDAAALRFLQAGRADTFADGWVHSKTVPFTIIAQVIRGRYEVRCPAGSTLAEPGEAFLTGAGVPLTIVHHADPGGIMASRWVHLHFELYGSIDVTSLLDMPMKIGRSHEVDVSSVIEGLLALQQSGASSPLGEVARTQALAWQALAIIASVSPPKASTDAFLGGCERLAPVLAFIAGHLDETLTVEALAERAHLSTSRFHALFREHFGHTPMEYLKHRRLDESRHLLLATEEPLSAVAERVGFANQFHFSREFKAAFGTTPSAYRTAHRDLQV
jgi:AraC-like DNA-binding protein